MFTKGNWLCHCRDGKWHASGYFLLYIP